MRYLSVCSGIEAASVAWHHLGWTPTAFSEIDPFPSAVLAHRFPDVPNLGDMSKFKEWTDERLQGPGSIDLLVGGSPCQAFSVAGLRKGLEDPRGNLMLTYLAIVDRLRPRWVVYENVPGLLSSNKGRDFGTLLGALGQLGYQYAYRVLDAQWVRTHSFPRAVVCSLSDILERSTVPPRYFLSSKACAGILRRAEKRGKALPPLLLQALQQVTTLAEVPSPAK